VSTAPNPSVSGKATDAFSPSPIRAGVQRPPPPRGRPQPVQPTPEPASLFETFTHKPWRRSVLVVGEPKIGKTTFAFGAPKPVFILTDADGLDLFPDEVKPPHAVPTAWDRYPGSDPNEITVIKLVESLLTGEHDRETLVLDTVNRLEALIWKWVCKVSQVDAIELVGGGYGKGYTRALEEVHRLIGMLQTLRERREMNWIAISHLVTKNAKDATQDDYERATLQLNEKAAGAWEGAVSTIIFAQPEIQHVETLNKDKPTERRKVEFTGRTIAQVKPGRGIRAGSRDLIRSPMILSWPEYERQAKAGADLRRQVYARRETMSLDERAQLDGRLAAAGYSWEAHEAELT